jgi:hypothetical protein
MATLHCFQDSCTDSPTCPCVCEDCYHAIRDALSKRVCPAPTGHPGIQLTLEVMAKTIRQGPKSDLARNLTQGIPSVRGKVRALIDALHESGASSVSVIDADDACLFVAAGARSLGIPCRFVALCYGESWTVRLRYEVDGQWEEIDCVNQSTPRMPDEEMVGEELRTQE